MYIYMHISVYIYTYIYIYIYVGKTLIGWVHPQGGGKKTNCYLKSFKMQKE